MKFTVDTDRQVLVDESSGDCREMKLYSPDAFDVISELWLKVGWNLRYSYTFTWLGRPVIQLPEDMLRIQEVIYTVKPDTIVETGVAHGGSLIFYASLCQLMERGRVLGIDIEIRPHNRRAIESHELAGFISLFEGDSTGSAAVKFVEQCIQPGETVLVILDSNHSRDHVLKELETYAPYITPGSYMVATDGIQKNLHDVSHGTPEWAWDNPVSAIEIFLQNHPEFQVEEPAWSFNESALTQRVTYWPSAFLRRS